MLKVEESTGYIGLIRKTDSNVRGESAQHEMGEQVLQRQGEKR